MKETSPASAGTQEDEPLRCDLKTEAEEQEIRSLRQRAVARLPRDPEPAAKRWQRTQETRAQHLVGSREYSARLEAKRSSQPKRPVRRSPGCIVTSQSRSRSREQSHAPRRTPKAASRSSASGDSSDPPGSSPAALAALLLYLLRVVA